MSKLVVEVCLVDKVLAHPMADRLEICQIKGWQTIIKKGQFQVGQKCVFFPPDAILLPELAETRLGIMKYLKALPKNELGERPPGGRVAAANLRGYSSYGVIMEIDPQQGDDPNWEVGTDLADYFKVVKFEPPAPECDEAEPECPRFYTFTDMEHLGNYPQSFHAGEEVLFTEKVHGKTLRLGLVLDTDAGGNPDWMFMCGSNDIRRKEWYPQERRFQLSEIVSETPPQLEDLVYHLGVHWRVNEIYERMVKPVLLGEDDKRYFGPEELRHYVRLTRCHENGEVYLHRSEFWEPLTDQARSLLRYLRDEFPWEGNKFSIIICGEWYGAGVQDLDYGVSKTFVAFDIMINSHYLNFDQKMDLFQEFGIPMVPILHRGPYSEEVVRKHTDGPTTLGCPDKIRSKFKGREGVVVLPLKERICPIMAKRCCLKSVSADYLARVGGTDFH